MSIKGSGGELFLGKQEATIITFWGNKIKIPYDNLKRIDYSYFKFGDGGYIDFVDLTNRLRRFEFAKKANEPVSRAITFMQENNPELDFVEHNPNDLKFYQKSWFILLLLFFCCLPLGLFLMWYYKKNTKSVRIYLTVFFTIMWGLGIYIQYQNAVTAKSEFQQSYENIMQSAYGEGNNVVESVSDTTVYPNTIPDTSDESGVMTFWNTMLEMFLNQMKLKSCSLIPGIILRIMNFCSLQQEINIFTPNFLYIILVNLIIQLGLYHLIAMLMILYVHNQY